MNERFWELVEQADEEGGDDPDIRDEVFARLIIQECIDICENSSIPFDISVWLNSTKTEMTALTALALSGLIKERFGVE